ncbi:Fibrinogen C domain-containing protein 1 [Branchiostoma belcheri]|nr:Fibrinogen C domain-containing protein 1 [Branchiostoma belcheri]
MYEQTQPVRIPRSGPGNRQTSGPPSQPPPVHQSGSRGRVRHGNGASDKLKEDQETSSHTYESLKHHTTLRSADRTYPGGASDRRGLCSFIRSHRSCLAASIAVLLSLVSVGLVPLTFIYKQEVSQLSTTFDAMKRDLDIEQNRTASLEQILYGLRKTGTTSLEDLLVIQGRGDPLDRRGRLVLCLLGPLDLLEKKEKSDRLVLREKGEPLDQWGLLVLRLLGHVDLLDIREKRELRDQLVLQEKGEALNRWGQLVLKLLGHLDLLDIREKRELWDQLVLQEKGEPLARWGRLVLKLLGHLDLLDIREKRELWDQLVLREKGEPLDQWGRLVLRLLGHVDLLDIPEERELWDQLVLQEKGEPLARWGRLVLRLLGHVDLLDIREKRELRDQLVLQGRLVLCLLGPLDLLEKWDRLVLRDKGDPLDRRGRLVLRLLGHVDLLDIREKRELWDQLVLQEKGEPLARWGRLVLRLLGHVDLLDIREKRELWDQLVLQEEGEALDRWGRLVLQDKKDPLDRWGRLVLPGLWALQGHQEAQSSLLDHTESRTHLDVPYSCPIGYRKWRETCFKAFYTRKTFGEAAQICIGDGGTLAMPRDAATNNFLANLQQPGMHCSYWIGLKYWHKERQWKWIDGSALGKFNFWASGYPVDLTSRRHALQIKSKWCNKEGNSRKRFFCQVTPGDRPSFDDYYMSRFSDHLLELLTS